MEVFNMNKGINIPKDIIREGSRFMVQEIARREFRAMLCSEQFHPELVKFYLQEFGKVNKNKRFYNFNPYKINQEKIENEYRKFIEENRYGRIEYNGGAISIPWVQCAQSN